MINGFTPGWCEITLEQVGRWCSGGTPSRRRPEFFGKGIPWVKSGDLPDGPITATEEEITTLGLQNSSAKLMPVGTISMALYGATIGKLGIFRVPAATNQACANVVPDRRLIDTHYLFYYLMSERGRFVEKGQGGAQPNISQEIVKGHPLPLAPLAEQRRIVAKLEAVLGRVSVCQRRIEKIPTILKRFRQSVLAAACSGRLTAEWRKASVEDSWNEVTLGEVLEDIHGGKSFSCTERPPREDEVGVLKISAITSGMFDEKESKTCTNKALVNPRYFVRTGDLLMSRANTIELVGAVAIVGHVKGKLMLSDKTLRLQVTPAVTPQWVWCWLRSDFGRSQIENLATGNQQSMRNISQDSIRSIRIQIPPREEQKQIEAAVQLLFDKAEHVARRFRFADAAVKKLRGSILAKAFRGELVPTEAELADLEGRSFESAEELLARIRNQEAPAKKTAARRRK